MSPSNTVWVLTEFFDDAPAETTVYATEAAAHADLAERARAEGLPEESFEELGRDASDERVAREMLKFWSSEMRLDMQKVTGL